MVELSPYVDGPYVEGVPYPTLQFSMVLNDVKGGQVTARVYVDTGSGFYPPSNEYSNGTAEYDPSVVTDDVWFDYIECPIDPPPGGGIAGQAKIIFDYVYPDGETGQIETPALPVHNGTYVRTNEAYGTGGYLADTYTEEETGERVFTMSFEVIIDRSLVVPSAVTPYHELWLSDPWTYYQDPTIELYTDGNGNSIMRFTYYSDTSFPSGSYWFSPKFSYEEDACNGWTIDDYGLNFYYVSPS